MDNQEFIKGQLWISEYEPNLGLGKITNVEFRMVEINFINSKMLRKYAIKTAPLKRMFFKIGDKIKTISNKEHIIDNIQEKNGLITYFAKEISILENEISEGLNFDLIEEKLLSGIVSDNNVFNLRYEILKFQEKILKSNLKGFLGSRTQLIPHQIYISQEVASRDNPRVMLADEAGLGKTIEAGMIIHNMLVNEKISRVLILTPQSLVNQWFVEMARKFNLSFNILDEDHQKDLDGEENPFDEYQLVISNVEFLAESEMHKEFLLECDWDLLVVDEAHRLEVSDEFDEPSEQYELVEELSFISKSLLLLTATPEQKGKETYFANLRLLEPEKFYSFEKFKKEELLYGKISNIISNLQKKEPLDEEQKKLLAIYLQSEKITDDTEKLINDLKDRHGTGRVLFRNTRKVMSNFPKRKIFTYPLTQEPKSDPKIQIIVDLLKKYENEKFLLICESKEKVLQIEKILKENLGIKTALFHEGLELMARDRNAAYFREENGATILLASEVGSEGRNFQFAHHLILFDLPFNAELIEQRIGRLDRIGQTEDINIHIPYLENTKEEIIFKFFHEGIGIFEEYVTGAANIFFNFEKKVLNTKLEDSTQVIKEVKEYKKKIKEEVENGRDLLLDLNSFNPKIAEKIITDIEENEQSIDLEEIMNKIFEHFGVDYELTDDYIYIIKPSDNMLIDHFPHLANDGATITYDRKIALEREDYKFITPDHPMVSSSIDLLLTDEACNTAFGALKNTTYTDIVLEIVFILECVAPKKLQINKFLPPTPFRMVIDKNLEIRDFSFEYFGQNLLDVNSNNFLNKANVSPDLIKNMINTAKNILSEKLQNKITNGKEKMRSELNYEITRIEYLKTINPLISKAEVDFAKGKLAFIENSLSNANLRVDSIRMVAV